ncbi:alpha/beta hydrolase [soil metagenome]
MNYTVEAVTTIPEWFATAIETRPSHGDVVVDGARIRYRSWGTPGKRDIMLVHGGAAHSQWWDHVAPLLATDTRLVALDLSGHGDSDHRDDYSISSWASEVLAVARDAGLRDNYTVIGHSLGGLIAAHLAQIPASPIGEAIVIDSPVGDPGSRTPVEPRGLVAARRRIYSSAEETIARFRPVPDQTSLSYIADHIAARSVTQVPGGWTWKFDSRILNGGDVLPAEFAVGDTQLAFFRSENGLVNASARTAIEQAGAIYVEIPNAGHAPMLDQPLALVASIRAVLAAWDAATSPSAQAEVTAR